MRILTCLTLFLACVALLCGSSHTAPATYPPAAHTAGGAVVPYYGATYGQPGGFSQADAKRVVELLESIDRRLEAIEAKGGPLAQKKADPLPVAQKRCAACHTQAKSDAKGGGFVLFADDGATALRPLSVREKNRVKEAVQSGAMPPTVKLNATEKAQFDW